jgi:hypothetical protein
MLDPIQYEFIFLFTSSADPEPEPKLLYSSSGSGQKFPLLADPAPAPQPCCSDIKNKRFICVSSLCPDPRVYNCFVRLHTPLPPPSNKVTLSFSCRGVPFELIFAYLTYSVHFQFLYFIALSSFSLTFSPFLSSLFISPPPQQMI